MNTELLSSRTVQDKTYVRLNPATGETASRTAAFDVHAALAATERAQQAFVDWSRTGPGVRRTALNRAADLTEERAADLVAAMIAETGCTAAWAKFNVVKAAAKFREAAAMTTQISGEVIPSDKPDLLALAVRAPAGVCLGIAPWNAPLILGVRAIAMPLACGNTVILKGSELSPQTFHLLGEICSQAGFPSGVVNVVTNAPEDAETVVNALIDHPAVRRINFTGSTRVGRLIAQRAALQLKPVLLELGGKAPLVVLEDADIDEAVASATFGAFMHQGQICMSTERIVLSEAIADAFVAKLSTRAERLKAGQPTEDCALGCVATPAAAEHAQALVTDAVSKGAVLRTPLVRTGNVLSACVVDHVKPGMRLYDEESFAPLVSIVRFVKESDAVTIANDTEYGLAASIYSRDVMRAMSLAQQIESGICHINGPTIQDEPQMPFGGVKSSGYGRFGGKAAIAEFTELRWITISTGAQKFPI